MGSLPNLNELDREKMEKRIFVRERELARERARERDFSRDKDPFREKDRLPVFIHQAHIPKNNQHHRHSLTSRKVLRTRSSGTTHHIWDDPMIEHMATYSPISSRSHRTGIAPLPYHIQQQQQLFSSSSNRRRESINSSIGATSIRRLLTVNRGCRHKIPVHVRAKIIKNFILIIIAHGISCAVFFPVVGLQGANSTWFHQEKWVHFGPDVGSAFLSLSFIITSGMCIITTQLIKKFGFIILFIINYSGFCLFLSAHLYPSIFTLLPGYIFLGIILGPSWVAKLTIVASLACKLSCNQHDYGGSAIENFDDHKLVCNRDESVRRLARWYHAAQDIGIIVGALIAAIILSCSQNNMNCLNHYSANKNKLGLTATEQTKTVTPNLVINHTNSYRISELEKSLLKTTISSQNITNIKTNQSSQTTTTTFTIDSQMSTTVSSSTTKNQNVSDFNDLSYQELDENINHHSERYIDEMFDTNDHGERICGVHSCPVWDLSESYYSEVGNKTRLNFITENMTTNIEAIQLMGIFVIFGIISLVLTCLLENIDNSIRFDPSKGLSDTIVFAGPMAYFIGTEQAYILADFSKAYVACALGPQMIAGAMIGFGIMQLIASCTLSMLLRHTKRIVVIAAGFFFHACLLLVLSRWKPSKDDSALFYVIAAAWGVCNAMWETLSFALVTLTHTNHVADVIAPLQGLRFLGLGMTFAAHSLLCEGPKIIILTILLIICVPPYALLEIRLETQRKTHMTNL